MRSKFIRWSQFIVVAFVAQLGLAQAAFASEVICTVNIYKVKIMRNTGAVRVFQQNGTYWGLCHLSEADCEGILSMALAAQLAGKSLAVKVNDAEGTCNGNANPADVVDVNIVN